MLSEMTIAETKKRIASLEDTMSCEDTVLITNHGREVFALMKWETYDCIRETLEIFADGQLSKDLAEGVKQIRENRLIDFDSFKQKLACIQ